VVFAGTGPLLYLVAWQYASHGGQVLAVLDTAPASAQRAAVSKLLARPSVAAKGAYFLVRLRLKGVAIHHGVTLLEARGQDRVSALDWRAADGSQHTIACDAIGFGHGLRSETQLADLAGCAFAFNPIDQAWLPTRDAAGRSSVPGVYLAGDGAGILGADAAELSGARAALAALEDLKLPTPAGRAEQIERELQAHRRFREGLETAFPPPPLWAVEARDDLIVCRCEEVTAGELRACARDTGAHELNRLKAFTRIGMGRCQGRICGPAAARLLAHATGSELQAVGRLRSQAPVKPLPVRMQHDSAPSTVVPEDQDD
jgi:NAD(P)H-nitrite reductase large subunit